MDAIKIVNLTKCYKDLTAVDKLNLQINQGELFSLLGINGAGKTTTIKMLSCLTSPTSGDAYIGGYSITGEELQVKGMIGVSPQETAVAPNLSVKENLELICTLHGFSKESCQDVNLVAVKVKVVVNQGNVACTMYFFFEKAYRSLVTFDGEHFFLGGDLYVNIAF